MFMHELLKVKVEICDVDALRRISPKALSSYALANGWAKEWSGSTFYNPIACRVFPTQLEIPYTNEMDNYADICGGLIRIFARELRKSQLEVYYNLSILTKDISANIKT